MENQRDIEKILSSLDNLQKAEMHPFLYEKIKHRMQSQKAETNTAFAFSWKLASVFVVVSFLNVFTYIKFQKQDVTQNSTIVSETNSNTENYYYNTSYNY